MKIGNLKEARAWIDELEVMSMMTGAPRNEGKLTPYQVLIHAAQSIEYSMSGYPRNRLLLQLTVGRFVLGKFLKQGEMKHDLDAPIPGAPEIPPVGDLGEAATRLRQAITDFDAFAGPCKPHFVYGKVSKADYARVHAMHIADHARTIHGARK